MSKSHQDRRSSRQRDYRGDMHDQLGSVLGRRLPPKPVAPLQRAASSWKEDGVDHINIAVDGATDLGRWLEFGKPNPFRHSIFELFNSVLAAWYYIRSNEQPDELRRLSGAALREFGQRITDNRKIKHIRAMVLDTAYQSLKQSPGLLKLFHENELPFDCYRTMPSGVRIRNQNHEWIIPGFMEIQRAIHSGTDPDFSPWCDGQTSDIYESVRPQLSEGEKARLEAMKARAAQKKQISAPTKPLEKKTDGKKKVAPEKQAKETQQKASVLNRLRREDHTLTPADGYCAVIPVLSEESSDLFLPQFHTTGRINKLQIPTGPVVSEFDLPLLGLSIHPELAKEGLIRDNDIIRALPVLSKSFHEGFETTNLMKLNAVVLKDGEHYIYIPVKLSLTTRADNNPGDTQTVQRDGETFQLNRQITIFKSVDSMFTHLAKMPRFVRQARELLGDRPNADAFKYLMMKLDINVKLVRQGDPTLNVWGTVGVVGMSTGPDVDPNKETVTFEPTADDKPSISFKIEGYTFSLVRGQLVSNEATAGTPDAPEDLTSQIAQALAQMDEQKVDNVAVSDEDHGDEATDAVISMETGEGQDRLSDPIELPASNDETEQQALTA